MTEYQGFPTADASEPPPAASPLSLDARLDLALADTFPASDPPALVSRHEDQGEELSGSAIKR